MNTNEIGQGIEHVIEEPMTVGMLWIDGEGLREYLCQSITIENAAGWIDMRLRILKGSNLKHVPRRLKALFGNIYFYVEFHAVSESEVRVFGWIREG